MTEMTWTADQKSVLQAFTSFYVDPNQQILVIKGFSGTGKSTVVNHLLGKLDSLDQMRQVLFPGKRIFRYELNMTATTNKAAGNLESIIHREVKTTASAMKLRLEQSPQGRRLVATQPPHSVYDSLIFVDEASFLDSYTLGLILNQLGPNTKLVFIGDPAQLLSPGADSAPVFESGFKEVCLTEVTRFNEDDQIGELSTKFRDTVMTGQWFNFTPDQQTVIHLPREDFEQAIVDEFTRSDWTPSNSRILAWRNKTVQYYNNGLSDLMGGTTLFSEGDMVVNNHFVAPPNKGGQSMRTDQQVVITAHEGSDNRLGLAGEVYRIAGNGQSYFVPNDVGAWRKLQQAYEEAMDFEAVEQMETEWADLRAMWASTVDKSQGSTYDKVFIDFDDIGVCRNDNQIARMGYVSVSRARQTVYMTGDL